MTDVMARAAQAYSSDVAAIGQEMADFAQTRLEHNIALGESLMRCHTLADMAGVQQHWLKETTEEYAVEARKLMELGSNLMRKSLAPMGRAAAQAAAEAVTSKDENPKQA